MAGFKGNTHSQEWLDLVYQADAWADLAINHTTTPITNIYAGLSTGTLTAASTQATTEATFTNYARVAVARSSSGWHRSGQTESNVAAISFPSAGSGPQTITDCCTGTLSSGAGTLLHGGPLTASRVANSGIVLSFAIDAFAVTES